jgi:hypothetical protein
MKLLAVLYEEVGENTSERLPGLIVDIYIR